MSSVNKAIIIGHLGRDPEVRYTPSGAAVCNVSVATTRSWKDKVSGEKVEETEWHRITFFDRLAEVVGEYLVKGSSIYVEGRLKTNKYTDKDGVEKPSTEIIAQDMKMLGGRPESDRPASADRPAGATAPQSRRSTAVARMPDEMDDDIEF